MANLLDESYIYAILDMPKINYQIVDGVFEHATTRNALIVLDEP